MAAPKRKPASSKQPKPAGARILVVEARFYNDIADALLAGAAKVLDEAKAAWDIITVPGSLEIVPAIAIAGCAIWLMLPQASDAEGHAVTSPEVIRVSQDTSRNDNTAGVQATLSGPAPSAVSPDANPAAAPLGIAPPETAEPAGSPLDGLNIISQSWRRGGEREHMPVARSVR